MIQTAILFLFLISIIYIFYVFLPLGNLQFLVIKRKDLQMRIKEDLAEIKIYIEGIEGVMREIDKRAGCFDKKNMKDILPREREDVIQLWAKYLDYQIALNKLVEYYKHFYQINYHFNNKLHIKAFFVGYASFISFYKNGVRLINYTVNNPLYEKILNDKNIEYGIAFGMYDKLKWNIIHFNDILRLTAGYENLKFLEKRYRKLGFFESNKEVFEYIDDSFGEVSSEMKKNSQEWFLKSGISILKKKTYSFWFPIQKNIAKQLGRIKISTRRGDFITKKQIIEMKKEMLPGDIMIARRNWYLGNIGIPGFWPHAAIYLGRHREFVRFFEKDEKVTKFLLENGYKGIDDFFRRINIRAYKDFRRKRYEVFEARFPGVIFGKMKHSARADYVGILRPNIEKIEIFKSIVFGMKHYKKPYDYHFDFVTDSAMVCSELVYKVYQNNLNLKLENNLGRPLFSPTDFVKKFNEEFENEKRELEFVYFLEGNEKSGVAVKSDVESFRKTWERSKWDIVQE